jgi:diguanylate cyclase (GGDEF)-like protein
VRCAGCAENRNVDLRAAALAAFAAAFLPTASHAAAQAQPPLAEIGAPLAADAPPASVLRPVALRAEFRVPRADGTALYIGAPWYVLDLAVTVVGPAGRRQTIAASADLPGRMLGLRLPDDAWSADRIELTATTVNGAAPPYLLPTEALAAIGWRTWWYALFCGFFGALAVVFGIAARALRSPGFAWYGAATAGQAALLIPWLGIVRPSPELSQPLHALLQALVLVSLAGFALVYLRAAALPRFVSRALIAVVALNGCAVAGGDVLQDLWPLPDAVSQALVVALYASYVALGVVSLRRTIDGAPYFLAGTALAALGALPALLWPGSAALVAAPSVGNAAAALLLPFALFVQLRNAERARARPVLVAHLDGLTGIANRAALDDALTQGWNRAARARSPLAAILVDIDHFRSYNDTYGHHAGDDALRRIAAALGPHAARGADLAGRYGGEEFLLLLPDTDLTGAQLVATRLRDAVVALEIAHGSVPSKRLSVSIGVASLVPEAPGDGGELMRRAARALYLAKAMGRNRVVADEPLGRQAPANTESATVSLST